MKAKRAIGVDLGGTYIKAGLVNEKGKILKKRKLPTLAERKNRKIVISQIEKIIKSLYEKDIDGIGIGAPGVVDDKGVVFEAPNLPDWNRVDLKKIFEQKFNKKVIVENDVNAIAWGEYLFGAGKGSKTMICITIGTGLGGGIVKNGKLLRGGKYSAVEIGHMTIDYKGPRCKCGNIGCIERFVGRDYIVEKAIKGIKKGRKTKILDIVNGKLEKITPKTIYEAYKCRDKFAKEVWIDVGIYLGAMLTSLVNLLNPDTIIIGGGISQVGKVLFQTIEKTIKQRAMKILSKDLKIVPASFGEDTGIISAASLILKGVTYSE